jgi:hypothetical protein
VCPIAYLTLSTVQTGVEATYIVRHGKKVGQDVNAAPSSRAQGTGKPDLARMKHLSIDPAAFAADFDQRPFYLEHDLLAHPLLELPAMAALSGRLYPSHVEWTSGDTGAYGKLDQSKPPTLPCKETILAVGERPTWVLLRHIEDDPPYKALLDELLDEIRPFSEQSRPGMCRRQAFLFISSCEAVTPYHFDPEHNFLLQVRGRKTVHMWDAGNRVVLPEAALDYYYANVRSNRDQPYHDDFLASARVLPLNAGQGVHFPLHAPHWVRTESDVSVSLSITFRSRQSRFHEAVHTSNGHVRRLGVKPPAPGASRLWDIAAHVGFFVDRGVRKGYNLLGKARRFASRVRNRFQGLGENKWRQTPLIR